MNDTHELKTDHHPFEAIRMGYKNFEIRWDDRGFKMDDLLILREWIPIDQAAPGKAGGDYTGRSIHATVTYILRAPKYGLTGKWCVMSINTRPK